MKNLLLCLSLLTLPLTSSMASSPEQQRSIEYWCTPQDNFKKIEAVLISKTNDESLMEVYTKGTRWGTVSVENLSSTVNETETINYISLSKKSHLSIELDSNGEQTPGHFYQANFSHRKLTKDQVLFCEYLP